jgi:hypothetical protein
MALRHLSPGVGLPALPPPPLPLRVNALARRRAALSGAVASQ